MSVAIRLENRKILRPMLEYLVYHLASIFAPKERKRALWNVENILGLKGSHAERFVRQNFYMQVVLIWESLLYMLGFNTHIVNRAEFETELETMSAIDEGILMVTAHLGAWEIMASTIAKHMKAKNKALYVLAKPARYKWLTSVIQMFRTRLGVKVFWNDSKSLLKDMIATLKSAQCLGFVMDQKPFKRQGFEVLFMDQPVAFVQGPEILASKFELEVFTVFFLRVGKRRYRAEWQRIAYFEREEGALTQIIADKMTQMIKAYPEQWTWNYKRWVTVPEVHKEQST
jgi:lauroyl/myristoyl acyltransferase